MLYRILSFFSLLFFFQGCAKVEPYEGFKAYYFGQYHKAFAIYSEACENGDPFMCHSVAGMFEQGLAVKQDYKQAFKHYLMACKNGIGYACNAVAKMYKEGRGVRHDPQKSVEYYMMGCERNLGLSCYLAGVAYYNKDGVLENKTLTKKLFGRACDLGDQKGCEIYKKLNEAKY